jgi:hypothetical protein
MDRLGRKYRSTADIAPDGSDSRKAIVQFELQRFHHQVRGAAAPGRLQLERDLLDSAALDSLLYATPGE